MISINLFKKNPNNSQCIEREIIYIGAMKCCAWPCHLAFLVMWEKKNWCQKKISTSKIYVREYTR
jgi:hypothetical protein